MKDRKISFGDLTERRGAGDVILHGHSGVGHAAKQRMSCCANSPALERNGSEFLKASGSRARRKTRSLQRCAALARRGDGGVEPRVSGRRHCLCNCLNPRTATPLVRPRVRVGFGRIETMLWRVLFRVSII